MTDARYFPIIRGSPIPWAVIAPHERQAVLNHDQTLERLAKRGGLSPDEALAVLQDRPWKRMTAEEAGRQLYALVRPL